MSILKVSVDHAVKEIENTAAAGFTPEAVEKCMLAIEPTIRSIQLPIFSYDLRNSIKRLLVSKNSQRAISVLRANRNRLSATANIRLPVDSKHARSIYTA